MSRKTIEVAQLVEWANVGLAMPAGILTRDNLEPDQAFRFGLLVLLEKALCATGNYQGFTYQPSEIRDHKLIDGYDDSRRIYY